MIICLCINKHMIKRVFTTHMFLFKYIQNDIAEVFSADTAFLYTINEVHENIMSLTNGRFKKLNKSKRVMKK